MLRLRHAGGGSLHGVGPVPGFHPRNARFRFQQIPGVQLCVGETADEGGHFGATRTHTLEHICAQTKKKDQVDYSSLLKGGRGGRGGEGVE